MWHYAIVDSSRLTPSHLCAANCLSAYDGADRARTGFARLRIPRTTKPRTWGRGVADLVSRAIEEIPG